MNEQTPIEPSEELPETFYGKNYGRVPTGAPKHQIMSYEEMLEADPGEIPPAAGAPGNYRPKPRRVSYDRYYDPDIAKLEDEHIWAKYWLAAAREEDVPNVGDRITFDIRDKSYLIVRTSENQIKAFRNTCLHRGRALCDHKGSGKEIRCPFHAWTYDLDGKLIWIPSEEDFAVKASGSLGLSEVKCDSWGGHVFINADPDSPPLLDALGPLPELFKDFPLEDRYTVLWLQLKVRANWKTIQEIFQEGYHVIETHWDSMAIFGETETSYDCWKYNDYGHVSRLVTPTGVPSGYFYDRVTIKQVVDQYVRLYCNQEPDPSRGNDLTDGRTYLADIKRETLSREYGVQVPEGNNARLLDFVKFCMFPNFHPWWGEQWPISYRFIPMGLNPEETLMEIRLTAPVPPGGERPRSVEPIVLDFGEDCTGHPELAYTGHIVNQDAAHMEQLQRGMRSAAQDRSYSILANYQEQQITYWHETYDRVLGLDKRQQQDG